MEWGQAIRCSPAKKTALPMESTLPTLCVTSLKWHRLQHVVEVDAAHDLAARR